MLGLGSHLSYVVHNVHCVPKRCNYAGMVARCVCEHIERVTVTFD
jgi:hypothetical protein